MVVVADLELGEEHNLVMDKFFQYLRSPKKTKSNDTNIPIFHYRTQSGIDRVFYARDSECGSPRFAKDVFSSLHLSFVPFLFICLVMQRCHVKTVIRF